MVYRISQITKLKIIFFAKGERGLACLRQLLFEKENVLLVVCQKNDSHLCELKKLAKNSEIEFYCPDNPNTDSALSKFSSLNAEIFILAGYGLILRKRCLTIAKICLNLHGGKLPEYRGSSPMNWALINGEKEIGISIIKTDEGIDTGDVLAEALKSIDIDTDIDELHKWANEKFPEILLKVLRSIKEGTLVSIKQDNSLAHYYPRRFPKDGFILWDQLNCIEAHNKIRALSDPYPCAYSYLGKRKIKFLSSKIPKSFFHGEAGRIYRKSRGSFLIGTMDQALWITDAIFADDQSSAFAGLNVYDSLSTIHQFVLSNLNPHENR